MNQKKFSEKIKILRSVRITHAGSSSYIVLNHLFLHNVGTNLPEVWHEVLSEVGLKFGPRLAQGFGFLVPKSPAPPNSMNKLTLMSQQK